MKELEMNDANRAYRNRQYKAHINSNKSFKSIEINNWIEILLVEGGVKKSMELIKEKSKTMEKKRKQINYTVGG